MKILVTLDGSTFSEAILPAAAQLAQATDSEVHLLSVVEDPSIRRSWVEAIAMGEAGTGEFMIPPASMPRYPDAGRGADMSTETLEEAIHSARQYLAEVALQFPAQERSPAPSLATIRSRPSPNTPRRTASSLSPCPPTDVLA